MLTVGTTVEKTWAVEAPHLASRFGSGLADVLATPVLIGFCEEACRSMVDPTLPPSQQTVGTFIAFHHTAATPETIHVTVRATLRRIEGRKLSFQVECRDTMEPIGHGEHTRFIVDTDRFGEGIARKRSPHGCNQQPTDVATPVTHEKNTASSRESHNSDAPSP